MTRDRAARTRRELTTTRANRLRFLALGTGLLYLVMWGRAFDLHMLPHPRLEEFLARRDKVQPIERVRGSIVDRDGRLLVARGDAKSVQAYPKAIVDPRRTAVLLSHELRLPADVIRRRITLDTPSVFVGRWVDREVAERIETLGLPGISIVKERRGQYPNGPRAAAYLGVAGYDEVARTGVELLFDPLLTAPPPAESSAEHDEFDRLVAEPQTGATVRLTLDEPLQNAAERVLDAAREQTGARHASLLALDPWNGDLLVVAESPGFDPYDFRKISREQLRVDSFMWDFEPGSTLKPFTIAIALDRHTVTADQVFNTENGRWRTYGRTIKDVHGYPELDVASCLRVSSNICLAKIGELLGAERLIGSLRQFGFGALPTRFPRTIAGLLRDLNGNQMVELQDLGFGQGMRTSALQLALATAALANGGLRVTPRLALAFEHGDGTSEDVPAGIGPRIIEESTAKQVLQMMEGVVEDGTGTKAALPYHRIAGKTGTGQKALPDGQGYPEGPDAPYVTSFVGVLPADKPRLVVVVVLDEPKGAQHTGGLTAAPVFREFATYAVDRLAIPRDSLLVAEGEHANTAHAGNVASAGSNATPANTPGESVR